MRAAPLAALLLALVPAAAAAQGFDGTQGLDTYTGPVISSGRIIGLGGAYVAVAEGLGGAAVNPAAVAQRNRHLDRSWDWDGVLTWYVPKVGDLGRQDLGNDGHADASLSGLGNAQLGGSLQAGRLGLAVLGRGWALSAPRQGIGSVEMEISDVVVAGGWAALREVLVVGASATTVSGAVRVVAPGADPETEPAEVLYSGRTLRFGALLRPRGRAWRLGLAFDPGARATPTGDRAVLPVATPAQFVFPWVVSAGWAAWLGPNARRFNEPCPFALEHHPEWGPGPEWEESRRRPVLVAVQVDVIGRAPDAVTVESGLLQSAAPLASGREASVALRAGAEWEPFRELLRVRGGGYLEPSRTGASARPHATFGLDLRVPFFWRDLQLGLAGDLAERFENVSLSLGFWSSLGPRPPPPPVPAE